MNIQNYPVLLAMAKRVSLVVAQLQTFQIKRGKHKKLGETITSFNWAIVWCLSVSWQTAGTIRQLQQAPTFWDKSFFCQTISCNCFLQNGLQLNSLNQNTSQQAVVTWSSIWAHHVKCWQNSANIYTWYMGYVKTQQVGILFFFFQIDFFFPPSKITLLFNK